MMDSFELNFYLVLQECNYLSRPLFFINMQSIACLILINEPRFWIQTLINYFINNIQMWLLIVHWTALSFGYLLGLFTK